MSTSSTNVTGSIFSDNGRQEFNLTLLKEFNYTIYSNDTLSNVSNCYLAFGQYVPSMLPNGTVLNGTSCETPYYSIATRGGLGIATATLFGLCLVMCFACLKKHGASYLPKEKRFRLVSRRWPWYWLIITAALGMVSGFTAIDIDRYYIQGTPLILQSIFYLCGLPTILAAVWEMTRHWASFNERKIVDEDSFRLRQDDRRSKFELYMPLLFYLWAFLDFFMAILRNWNPIKRGHERPSTDARFKASSFFAVAAWLTIICFLFIAKHYYKTKFPLKITLSLVFVAIRLVYNIICAWNFEVTPLNASANPAPIYTLGYVPVFLVFATMIIAGFREPNEDLEILRLRRQRSRSLDAELNNLKKA